MLSEASVQGDLDPLNEMKAVKSGGGCQTELPEDVIGTHGPDEIVDTFLEVYNELYNNSGTQEEKIELKEKVAKLIKVNSMGEVIKLTGMKLKEAVSLLKQCKGDVSGGYTSDDLLNGPDVLFDQLATVFRILACSWDCQSQSPCMCFLTTAKELSEGYSQDRELQGYCWIKSASQAF